MEVVIAITANLLIGAILLGLFAWRRPHPVATIGANECALDEFRKAIPDADGRVVPSADGSAALLLGTDPDMTCLLTRHGRRYNVRTLHRGEVGSVLESGASIKLRLHDFGWSEIRICIPDPCLRAECLVRLSALKQNPIKAASSVQLHA